MVQTSAMAGGSGSRLTEPFLTVREVATQLRVCTATVYRLCETGQLGHTRVSNAIRVSHGDLQAYLRRPQHGNAGAG